MHTLILYHDAGLDVIDDAVARSNAWAEHFSTAANPCGLLDSAAALRNEHSRCRVDVERSSWRATSQPSPPPFTEGELEMGLHFAADASPDDAARGITGGVGMLCGGAMCQ
eukprot:scaffold74996_cov51-Phaeocystis_antarctica.AAC.3